MSTAVASKAAAVKAAAAAAVSKRGRPMTNANITTLITTPSKVAHAFDWKKGSGASLLGLNVARDRIDLAVTAHPSMQSSSGNSDSLFTEFDDEFTAAGRAAGREPLALPSIPVHLEPASDKRRYAIPRQVAQQVLGVLREWNVCGIVVGWPVQKEGWCGAACGRVLFTLDQFVADGVLSPNGGGGNPAICLWENHGHDSWMHQHAAFEDSWGRSPMYAYKEHLHCQKKNTVHLASKEQYDVHHHSASSTSAQHNSSSNNATTSRIAVECLKDFCEVNWPHLYYNFESDWGSSSSTSATTKQMGSLSLAGKPKKRSLLATSSAVTIGDDDDDDDDHLIRHQGNHRLTSGDWLTDLKFVPADHDPVEQRANAGDNNNRHGSSGSTTSAGSSSRRRGVGTSDFVGATADLIQHRQGSTGGTASRAAKKSTGTTTTTTTSTARAAATAVPLTSAAAVAARFVADAA